MMKVVPNRPFYTFVVDLANAKMDMSKDIVIGKSSKKLSTIVEPEVSSHLLLVHNKTKYSTVTTVSISTSNNHFEKMMKDATVDSDWRNDLKIPEEYKKQ